MRSEKQILRINEMSSTTNKKSHKANLANAETARLKADNETASPNFGLWDLDKKKEQFLTIDRF
jgi:hypothetical protein